MSYGGAIIAATATATSRRRTLGLGGGGIPPKRPRQKGDGAWMVVACAVLGLIAVGLLVGMFVEAIR